MHFVLCPKQCNKTECVVLKTSKQGVTCIKGIFGRGWGGRNWHHFENREAPGKRRDPWNDKDHVTGISHEQKVSNVMAQQDLWVFTCWAEFWFWECKEIATGHDKTTGSHLFLLFRKVISLFYHFVMSPFCHFAIFFMLHLTQVICVLEMCLENLTFHCHPSASFRALQVNLTGQALYFPRLHSNGQELNHNIICF